MLKLFKKSLTISLILLINIGIFIACEDDTGPGDDTNITERVTAESNLSTLEGLLSETELADTLSQEGPLTLFAPTDEALSDEQLGDLTNEEVKEILSYHIVESNLTYDILVDTESVEAMSEETLFFSTDGETVLINEGQGAISSDGFEATNGTIFKIDTLLTPPQE